MRRTATHSTLETGQFAGAMVLGVGRVDDENGRMGTCIFVRLADGRKGGIWYDRDEDLQGTLQFVESQKGGG